MFWCNTPLPNFIWTNQQWSLLTSHRNILHIFSFYFITKALQLSRDTFTLPRWILLISYSHIRNLITLFSFLFESLYTFTFFFQIPSAISSRSFFIETEKWIHTYEANFFSASQRSRCNFLSKVAPFYWQSLSSGLLWTVGKKLKPKRNQIKTKCYPETFMQYLIENPEATHFCLLTNLKKLERISRNGLKKLCFAGWL